MSTIVCWLMLAPLIVAAPQEAANEPRMCRDASCLPVWAAMISVYVIDEAGAAIQKATVIGRFAGEGRTGVSDVTAVTDRYGMASFSVPAGTTGRLSIDATGFKSAVMPDVMVRAGTALTVLVPMELDVEKVRGIVDYPPAR